MRFSPIALLIGSAVAAPTIAVPQVPAQSDVKIIGVNAIGTGCPAGHAFVTLDATGTIFDVAFDQYYVSVGPGSRPNDARKNCRISINLSFPMGYALSIIETRFTGYASLAAGQTGTCRAGYTFSGDSSQEIVFQKNIVAPHEDNYNMIAGVGVESWSPCGKTSAVLNVNSEVRINPVTSPSKGLMTVRTPIKLRIQWQACDATTDAAKAVAARPEPAFPPFAVVDEGAGGDDEEE